MEVDDSFSIEWESVQDGSSVTDGTSSAAAVMGDDDNDIIEEEYLVGDEIIPSSETIPNSLDQIAAENLIYMAHDGNVAIMGDLIEEQVEQAENADYNGEHQYFECQVQEEVITDDWVQQPGEDRGEVPIGSEACIGNEEVDVPLPTDQDEYTTSRPYPCDFCSRRFRKKANLMNHMVAHKNDRPHICNLCGARYIRRVDLLSHLKVHAQVPEQELEDIKPIAYADTQRTRKPAKAPKLPRAPKQKRVPISMRNLSPPPIVDMDLIPTFHMKREFIQQEDMQLLLDAAHQQEQQQQQQEQESQLHQQYEPVQHKYEPPPAPEPSEVEPPTDRYPIIDPDRPFVCQKCGVSFAREKALLSHSRMHGTDTPLECDSCSEMFWDVTQLRDHQKLHHVGQSSNSEYEPDADADKDSDSDADSKYGVFYCSVCGISFHRNELLQRHQKTHVKYDADQEVNTTIAHNDAGGGHSCTVCGDSFAEALDLLAHAEVHTRYQPFKCMLCGETFLEEAHIKRHIVNVHGAELTDNSCRLCGKLCRDSRTLMKHSWEHSTEKNHPCSKCGKTFHNKARLKRHMQSHRNKSVTCDVCGEEFPDGRSLMNHRHSHTNVSGRQFPCKECGKTFGSRSSQQIHMRIHTGERPYGCRFCWKAFADGGTLRKHERIHTGEKPYACPVCPRAFNQRVVLREHIRSHHSGPNSKFGNTANPFYCSVCGDSFGTSVLLIQHLIEHSDMNTALKRQPPTGPRKYKRRRKLKPHELEHRARNEKKPTASDFSEDDEANGKANENHKSSANNQNGFDDQDDDDFMDFSLKSNSRRDSDRRREKKTSLSALDDHYYDVENTLQNIDSLVIPSGSSQNNNHSSTSANPSPAAIVPAAKPTAAAKKRAAAASKLQDPPRPKMIHTQKTRVPVDENGKRKTRTLITRTTPGKETPTKMPSTRSRRTAQQQNVTIDHQAHTISIKEEDFLSKPLSETEILLKLTRKNPKYSPDVVNDLEEILRSPIKGREIPDDFSTMDPMQMHPSHGQSSSGHGGLMRFIALSPARDLLESQPSPMQRQFESGNQSGDETESGTEMEQLHHHQHDDHHHQQYNELANSDTESDPGHHHHDDDDSDDELRLPMRIKQEMDFIVGEPGTSGSGGYTCEMCSAVFMDRAQLLLHVPIHI